MVLALFILGGILIFAFFALTQRGKDKEEQAPVEMKEPVQLVEDTLQSLNISYEKKEGAEHMFQYRFSFQDGNYILFMRSDSAWANLVFPGVLTVNSGEVDLIRALCNNVNLNAMTHYLYYSYEESDNTMAVHVSATVLLDSNISGFREYFVSVLTRCFSVRHHLHDLYDHNGGGQKGGSDSDPEAEHNDRSRVGYIMREIEMANLDRHNLHDYEDDGAMRLGNFMRCLNGAARWTIISMREVGDEVHAITDPDAIENYSLLDAITIADGEGDASFTADNKVLLLDCVDTGGVRKRPHLITLTLEADLETEQALYVRITLSMARQPLVYGEDIRSRDAETWACTFLAARDKASGKAKRAEFKYMWEDAKDKIREGKTEEMTDEQRFAVTATQPSVGYDIYWGKKYFNDKRYFQASTFFSKAWNELNSRPEAMKGKPSEAHHEACFYLGMCCMMMHRYTAAYYFFDLLLPLQNIRYTRAFVDCIVRLNDFRAELIIENFISTLRVPQDDETDEESERLRRFMRFLCRSKSLVLLHKHKLDEAEELLKQMLDNQEDADFALTQLAKIQKIRDVEEARREVLAPRKDNEAS